MNLFTAILVFIANINKKIKRILTVLNVKLTANIDSQKAVLVFTLKINSKTQYKWEATVKKW